MTIDDPLGHGLAKWCVADLGVSQSRASYPLLKQKNARWRRSGETLGSEVLNEDGRLPFHQACMS